MARRMAGRLFIQVLMALAIAALALVFLASDNKPTSLNLPPFEKELYLSVTAKWAPNDCVDVTAVTNLPKGTVYWVAAQARPWKANSGNKPLPMDRLVEWTNSYPVLVEAQVSQSSSVFCGIVRARRVGRALDTNGLLLAASVSGNTSSALTRLDTAEANAEQARRVGERGSRLCGPLASSYGFGGDRQIIGHSKTFILEPLPMLPEDEESEEEEEEEIE